MGGEHIHIKLLKFMPFFSLDIFLKILTVHGRKRINVVSAALKILKNFNRKNDIFVLKSHTQWSDTSERRLPNLF